MVLVAEGFKVANVSPQQPAATRCITVTSPSHCPLLRQTALLAIAYLAVPAFVAGYAIGFDLSSLLPEAGAALPPLPDGLPAGCYTSPRAIAYTAPQCVAAAKELVAAVTQIADAATEVAQLVQ